jgi:predicted ester cyclase
MSFEDKKAVIKKFVDGINRGDLEVIDQFVDRDFFNYSPPAGEETAQEVLRDLGGDLLSAFPDLEISATDFVDEGETITCTVTMSGTLTNSLWGAPGTGKHASWTSKVTSRFNNGQFAFSWRDLSVPEILKTLRQVDLVPPPDKMDQPPIYPVSMPEFLLKVVLTGQVAEKACSHLDLIQVIEPEADVCRQCVTDGDIWPALRMCLVCGFIGCCDTSKNKHMKQHYEATGHPIFRSIRLDESWVWCYEDDAFLSGRILDKYR